MQITYKPTKELIPYVNNSRTHDDKQITQIASSIKEFGFTNPLLIDENDSIIAGHGRLMAANKLKISEVPCIILKGLTEAQKKAYVIADNKLALNAGWDEELLKIEIEGLKELDFDIDILGFDTDELDNLLSIGADEVVEDDFEMELPEEPKSKRGDVWTLGRHRLMCGDSTTDDVDILMDGKKADITFTSPPYNAGSTPKEKGKYHNNKELDNKTQKQYSDFLNAFTLNCLNHSDYVFSNIQSLSNNKLALIDHLYELKDKYADTMIWNKGKGQPAMARRVLNSAYEYIYIFSNEATRAIGKKDFRGTIPNIFELSPNKDKEFADIHKATFRIDLPKMFIEWFTETSVIDVFGGTGTTLIASEQLNRICYMMELDEKYIDVIVHRYKEFKQSTEGMTLLRNGQHYSFEDIFNVAD